MYRVLTTCPTTGQEVASHALMKRRDFARFKGTLTIYCSRCRVAHVIQRNDMILDTPEQANKETIKVK